MVKVTPLGDNVIIEPDNSEMRIGHIIIPDIAKEVPENGVVRAVGPGKTNKTGDRIQMEVKPGDQVMYGKYAGEEYKIDDIKYLMMPQSSVLLILE